MTTSPPPAAPDGAPDVPSGRGAGVPTVGELDALSTDELRHRAVDLARHRRDVGFFWDLVKHLPAASDTADADASAGGTFETIQDTIELVREMSTGDYGSHEPMIRARFIDYLRSEGPRS